MGTESRIEKDILGVREIPGDEYWGIHTARAFENFSISGRKIPRELIIAFANVKRACAVTNNKLGYLDRHISEAIEKACREIEENDLISSIIVDAYQGGAGTSTNLNMCEVVANRALEIMKHQKGDYRKCDPLEHVNLHQSTNDTYPTALRIAVFRLLKKLEQNITILQESFQEKEKEFAKCIKIARTELMDAVPMTLGRSFGAWAEVLSRDRWRIFKCTERIRVINLGGTAIGTGMGAPQDYVFRVADELRVITDLPLSRAENLLEATQNQDALVEVMGMLKTHAMNLMKISGDLRMMAMGPDGGIGEIHLPAVQSGSSIMPNKINPVMAEMITQVAIQVSGHEHAVAWALGSGQMELNAFLPLVALDMIESLVILGNANFLMAEKCVKGITADEEQCRGHAIRSRAIATVLVPVVGYHKATEVAKHMQDNNCDFITAAHKITRLSLEACEALITPEAVNALGTIRKGKKEHE